MSILYHFQDIIIYLWKFKGIT